MPRSRAPFAALFAVLLATGMVAVSLPASAQEDGYRVRPAVEATGDPRAPLRIDGAGWGHGVGMSQYGAYAMSRAGHGAADILGLYYPGTTEEWRSTDRPVRVGICATPGAVCTPVSSTWVRADSAAVRWDVCPAGVGGAPADSSCQRGTAETGGIQARGTVRYVCPEVVEDAGGARIPQQRVQDRRCGAAGAVTHFTTQQPVVRVHHSAASGSTVDLAVPGPGQSTTDHAGVTNPMIVHRGTHDIVRVASATTASLVRVQNLRSVQEYLYGIAEVPASWGASGGQAALRAQAITARTYGLRTFADRGGCRCDIFATPSHQAYNGKAPEVAAGGAWKAAVDATFRPDDTTGRVLTYDGRLAETYYSSSHGGRTENSEDSWAFSATVPYLRSVADPWSLAADVGNPYRWWRATGSNAGVAALVSETSAGTVATVERLAVVNRSDGGTPAVLRVTGRTAAGERITFDYAGSGSNNAGSRIRVALPTVLTERAGGGTASLVRTPSSQISRFSFAPFDDDDGNVHEYAIVWADRAGVVNGRTETTFAPEARLRRDQMATMLFNTFDVPPATEPHPFTDVGSGNAHAGAIAALHEAGIAGGTTATTFSPGDPLSRAQMATLLAKAAGWDGTATTSRFSDVSPSHTHLGGIEAVAERGVTSGCAPGRYCPGDSVTRGQMASFLYRLVVG